MNAWTGLIIGLLAGAAIGAGIMFWRARRAAGGASIEALKRENAQFREQVTEHFVETARLINQMTDSYKAVFDHLSQGADRLVDGKALAERMPRVSDQEVRLRHLGAPEPGRKQSTGNAARDRDSATGKNGPVSRPAGDQDPLKRQSQGGDSKPAGKPSSRS